MRKLIPILTVLMVVSGCSDFIEVEPQSQFTASNFFKTEEDMNLALNGAYDGLQSIGQYGQYFVYFMEVSSDNSIQESSTNSGVVFAAFDIYNVQPSNDVVNTSWNNCYDGINRVNTILDRVDEISMDDQVRNVMKGEAKFLRVLTYFNLVRIWGDVPLITSETTDPILAFKIGRSPITEVYDLIENDLLASIQSLGVSTDPSRASINAAKALLAKVYLTEQKYTLASAFLTDVIGGGNYQLLSSFQEVFSVENESNAEILFEVQFTESGSANAGNIEGSRFSNLFAPIGALQLVDGVGSTSGDNLPSQDLYDAYSAADARLDGTIGTLADGRIYTKKYLDVPLTPYNAENNFIVIRYADVLLMQAEVLNEIGYSAAGLAFDYLNEVRARAGLAPRSNTDVSDQAAFRDAVLLERRLELAFENHRWFDLVRTGNAIATLDGHSATNGPVTLSQNQLLYPIPQAQIDIMNNEELMYQNPGYQ